MKQNIISALKDNTLTCCFTLIATSKGGLVTQSTSKKANTQDKCILSNSSSTKAMSKLTMKKPSIFAL